MKLTGKLLSLTLIVYIVFNVFFLVNAQDDCGSGVPQRLTIGGQGRVIQGQSSNRLRDAPSGNQVGFVETSETFTVLDGPRCNNNISWWQVQTSAGLMGWTAEGLEGEAFLEPIASASGGGGGSLPEGMSELIPDQNITCETESAFELGQLVNIINPESVDEYFGHPLIDGAFYRFPESTLNDSDLEWGSMDNLTENTLVLLSQGPICYNGAYLWQIGMLNPESYPDEGEMAADTHNQLVWVYETTNGLSQFRIVNRESSAAFVPQEAEISLASSAPIVDQNAQLIFAGGGGCETWGCAGMGALWFDERTDCTIGYLSNRIDYFQTNCIEIYPLPITEALDIKIYSPEGDLYEEYTLEARNLNLRIEPNVNLMGFGSEGRLVSVNSVQIPILHKLGDASGAWRIEVVSDETITSRSYWLEPITEPSLQLICEGASPVLTFSGFEANEAVELIFVEDMGYLESNPEELIADERDYELRGTWNFELGAYGDLRIPLTYPFGEGYFVLADDGEWESRIDRRNGTPWDAESPLYCPVYTSEESSALAPIAYGQTVTGKFFVGGDEFGNDAEQIDEVFYSFRGNAGDIISIYAYGTDPDAYAAEQTPLSTLDTDLRLLAPNGSELAANDDASDSESNPTDSALEAYTLPETGLYTIRLTYNNPEITFTQGFYLSLASVSLGVIEAEINIGDIANVNLPDKDQWAFEATTATEFVISAQSIDFDIQIRLLDAEGNLLAEDDDSGGGMNAEIRFTPDTTAIYIIEISSWNEKTGEYTLEIRQ